MDGEERRVGREGSERRVGRGRVKRGSRILEDRRNIQVERRIMHKYRMNTTPFK